MAEGRVGILVPNLFVRIPVDAAIRGAGAMPVALADSAEARRTNCSVVIIDLEAAGDAVPGLVEELTGAGRAVLAFGPHVEEGRLAAARGAGAVVLPRGAFLARLPELLAAALAGSEG